MSDDWSQFSLLDLFRMEAETQAQALTAALLSLEQDAAAAGEVANPATAARLEECMRAAHSLKGAARIVDVDPGVAISHAMEEAFVAAQEHRLLMTRPVIDLMLRGVDLLLAVARAPDLAALEGATLPGEIAAFVAAVESALGGGGVPPASLSAAGPAEEPTGRLPSAETPLPPPPPLAAIQPPVPLAASSGIRQDDAPLSPQRGIQSAAPDPVANAYVAPQKREAERMVRITAESLNRLLGLAGESLMEARRLRPFGDRLQRVRRRQMEAARSFELLRAALAAQALPEAADPAAARAEAVPWAAETQQGGLSVELALAETQRRMRECEAELAERLAEFEEFDRRGTHLSHYLYEEALGSRMRPFEDGVQHFARVVRDLGHELGKMVRLEIIGGDVNVDRDILEKLEAPLGHLLRNAIDHGVETPDSRIISGKPAEARLRLEARHASGMLQISVTDDGCGVDLDKVRATVAARGMADAPTLARLSEAELLEFLFLPGFTTTRVVTDISGRGVGLDTVQAMVRQLRGSVAVETESGRFTRIRMKLPLTLSVLRALLVEVGGEPYAFPLAAIGRAMDVPRAEIQTLEGRQHFMLSGHPVPLVAANQMLGGSAPAHGNPVLSVIVVGEGEACHGLVVDRFLGERELVVRPLDARLGKVPGISAASLLEDGSPVLIVDVEDLLVAVSKLSQQGGLGRLQAEGPAAVLRRRRVLVVDDSLTIRELERKLLEQAGYEVDVAVDGMDGWNAARTGHFDLVVTDIDMPRMDGIELVGMIKRDQHLASLPVMIVSYKDREEDRRRGLEAGADYYLTKGSFQDETLIQAVVDLVGPATG